MLQRFLTLSFFLMSLICFGFSGLSYAQDEAPQEQPAQDPESEKDDPDNADAKKKSDVLRETVMGKMTALDQSEMKHFMTIYANYNILSTVKAVGDDVKGAVDACATNNPEMADDLNARYDKWKQNVGVKIDESQANIDNMVLAQTYIPQSEIQSIFGQVDEMRAINSSNFEKTPVTTPEACEFMLSKMDETEENMKYMLVLTLKSYPDMLKKTQE